MGLDSAGVEALLDDDALGAVGVTKPNPGVRVDEQVNGELVGVLGDVPDGHEHSTRAPRRETGPWGDAPSEPGTAGSHPLTAISVGAVLGEGWSVFFKKIK